MANYKPLGVPFDRTFRNDLNDNFKTLDGVASSAKADTGAAKQSAEKASYSAERAKESAISAKVESERANEKADATQAQLDNIVLENGNSDAEVVQARGSEPLLYQRLDKTDAKLRDVAINIRDTGAVCDGLTDDTEAIRQALEEGAGGTVLIPAVSIITDTIVVPPFTKLMGTGGGYNRDHSSLLIAKGSGAKAHSIPGATATVVANPSKGAPYLSDSDSRGDEYKTLDLSVPFSAAIILSEGSAIENVGVIPYFDGVDGYKGTDGRLSDDWDVGVWARNSDKVSMTNAIVEGHWRRAGLLVSSHNLGDGKVPANELGQFQNCSFSGFRGVAIRNPNSDTGSTNYGFGGTDFINCYIKSLDHQSRHLATSSFLDTPFQSPSTALEIDGTVVRGVQFTNCTFMGRDDLNMILGKSSETMFIGSYHESKSIKVAGAWLNPSVGSRVVATSDSVALRFIGSSKYGVDFSPYYRKEPSVERYGGTGAFNPSTCQNDEETYPMFSTSSGMRLSNTQNSWKIWDADFKELFKYSPGVMTIGNSTFNLERLSADVVQHIMRVYGSGNVEFPNGETYFGKLIRPITDNAIPLGASSSRWSTVYAGTGSINTSDRNSKTGINSIDDRLLDAWAEVNYCQYKFKDAVIEKGDGARTHIGIIAQEIEEIFNKHGINAFDYGLLCYDEWGEQVEIDEDGNEVVTADAGSRYSIRPDECLMLEAALMRRELSKFK
ncbi:tail fiber domain-containing protein [Rossellomorea marisflavi]|uniref:tail fiber domain-containing protein n=1 Tax=Rossellomorea marisflavi TaxID=189381 RepID=UPI0028535259|nr:tail fiber domain-containing protein [Rossellomorea marisflavi]MDR4936070.1 tail fiber domain-containing protein [Rossellomorea marisflavi]